MTLSDAASSYCLLNHLYILASSGFYTLFEQMLKVVYNLFVNLPGINVYMSYNFSTSRIFENKTFKKSNERFRVFFRIDMCSLGLKACCRFLISDENKGFIKAVLYELKRWKLGLHVFTIIVSNTDMKSLFTAKKMDK